MGSQTGIEWTNSTLTPIRARHHATGKVGWHCEKATAGCEFCYAEGFNQRLGTGLPFKPGHRVELELFLDEKMLEAPLRWRRPRMIFMCSMTDLFASFVKDQWLSAIFAMMARAPHHTFQLLTKRADRMKYYLTHNACEDVYAIACRADPSLADRWRWPLPNVWCGVSVERQPEADERVPDLLDTPAAVRFLSCEPLLGRVSVAKWLHDSDCRFQAVDGFCTCSEQREAYINQVIVGGESGRHARPMHPGWPRLLRDECAAAPGTAFYFKQWGEWQIDTRHGAMADSGERETWIGKNGKTYNPSAPHDQDCWAMKRVGKKAAGRLLDGVEHSGIPGRT
jgi:protein gp37